MFTGMSRKRRSEAFTHFRLQGSGRSGGQTVVPRLGSVSDVLMRNVLNRWSPDATEEPEALSSEVCEATGQGSV